MSVDCETIVTAFGVGRTTRAEGDRVPQEIFFETVQRDGYSYTKLNRAAINELRTTPSAGGDEEAAHALIDLLIDDLPQDPEHDGLMDNSDTGAVIRCLKAVLRRLGIEVEVPFHDKQGYYSFRIEHNHGLSTDLTRVFAPARAALERREKTAFTGGLRGPRGELRNLIFAAVQKPEIVWRDVAGGVIEITKNKEHCLLYDHPVGAAGLTWSELCKWWHRKDGMFGMSEQLRLQALLKRLRRSLNVPEQLLLDTYWDYAMQRGFGDLPALLPQVYLHYDPLTQHQRNQRAEGKVLRRQRMDFLMLAPGGRRYVFELDGQQHYSRDGKPDPDLYADMVREDRRIRLQGYEVYRFGGAEVVEQEAAKHMLTGFFDQLLAL
jgi:very-short-patch-repair endonuclease